MNDDHASPSPAGFSGTAEPMAPNLSPQSVVDCASLTNCMNKNKESLKVKLMLRRPINVLVDQGILPPPKSSPLFHEQKQKLERAKTGDFLKHKIQRRPPRDELVQQHILEDSFDPSYYEQERKLKKARLADDLNERLSQRPGPLELIKGNILHTDETLEQAIKEGQIQFKKTCEGEIIKNPPKRFVFEEESSSDSAPSPHQTATIAPSSCTLVSPNVAANYQLNNSFIVTNGSSLISIPHPGREPNSLSTYIVTTPHVANILPSTTTAATTVFIANDKDTNSNNKNILNVTANLPNVTSAAAAGIGPKCIDPIIVGPSNNNQVTLSNSGATQIQQQQQQKPKKKVKSKNQPKIRTIKFHEYTGPPNAKKQSNSSQSAAETSYELLLKQQQMFLQWQLECQQKYPHMAQQKMDDLDVNITSSKSNSDSSTKSEMDKKAMEEQEAKPTVVTPVTVQCNANNVQLIKSTPIKPDDQPVPFECINSPAAAPAAISNASDIAMSSTACLNATNSQSLKQYTPTVKKIISKLEDMKVSDLKAELKKRNLPVSGPKQQLIERLKPFSDLVVSTNNSMATEVNGGATATAIFTNLGECKNQDILNNNFTPLSANSTATATAFILKNNITTNGEVKKDELYLIANSSPLQLKPAQPAHQQQQQPATLTIPIANTFIPQYQLVSSTPTTDNKINLSGINLAAAGPGTIQTAPTIATNNILVNNKLNILNHHQPAGIISTFNHQAAANQIGEGSQTSQLTILTAGEPIQLGSLAKNGQLSFNIATQPTAAMNNITTATTNKLVSIQNASGPVFHQLLLYPTAAAPLNSTPQDISTALNGQHKQRSNSLPSETMHQLQRNTSLPLVINQVPVSQVSSDSTKSMTISEKMILDNVVIKPQPQIVQQNQSMSMKKNEAKSSRNDSLPNSSSGFTFATSAKQQLIDPKSIKLEFGVENQSQAKTFEAIPIITSTIIDYNPQQHQPPPPPPPATSSSSHTTAESMNSQPVLDSSTNQIQPDSTTSCSSLDLDFILNFDDLHDGLGGEMATDGGGGGSGSKSDRMMDEPMDTTSNKNGMIEFSDNWFDLTFGQSSDCNELDTSQLMDSDSGVADSSFLDTINQIFDQNFSTTGCGSSITSRANEFAFDPVLSQSNISASTSSGSISSSSSGGGGQHSMMNFPNQACHFSAAYSGSALNKLNGSNSSFSVDSLSDFLLEDHDFKASTTTTSYDFPIMMDKVDFAT